MSVTVILGAGASRAEGILAQKENHFPNELLPPLDKTVFEQANKRDITFFSEVASFVKSTFGIDLRLKQVSSEYIFNLLLQLTYKKNESAIDYELYILAILYRNLISLNTSELNCNYESGIFGLLKQTTTNWEIDEISLITLNYDLLIEKALENIDVERIGPKCSESRLFDILYSYQVDFDGYFWLRGGKSENKLKTIESYKSLDDSVKRNLFEIRANKKYVSLLKLHGSLNWFYEVPSSESREFALPKSTSKSYLSIDRNPKTGYSRDSEGARHKKMIQKRPIMVPPVYDKVSFFANLLNPLWEKAGFAIRRTEKLIFYGYSLPDADIGMKMMLANSIANNQKLESVEIIDTNPAVCEKYINELPIKSINYYESIEEYLSKNS